MELNLTDGDVMGSSEGGASMRSGGHGAGVEGYGLTPERAKLLREIYAEELAGRCTKGPDEKGKAKAVDWDEFVSYADEKEKGMRFICVKILISCEVNHIADFKPRPLVELWNIFHNELDLDGNGHLDASEWAAALSKSGISLSPHTLQEFMTLLTRSSSSYPASSLRQQHQISFPEFRDFLLLMPRHATTAEIYRYYEVRRFDHDARGAARINMEGSFLGY